MEHDINKETYCTQGRDQECGKDNCCLGVKDVPKHFVEMMAKSLAKQIDNDIVNWSISCEKNQTINRHQFISDGIECDSF